MTKDDRRLYCVTKLLYANSFQEALAKEKEGHIVSVEYRDKFELEDYKEFKERKNAAQRLSK